jgi:hypothetical protein
MELSDWERHLCAPLTGRKAICAFEVLASMTRTVARFQRWGVQRPLLIGDGAGTGPLPLETDADILLIDIPDVATLTEQVRTRMQPESRMTPDLMSAVEAYDPVGEAIWWLSPLPPNLPLLGRPVLGGRPPHQIALEDKLVTDLLLDGIAAERSPSKIAAATYDSLVAASSRLKVETGAEYVVWAGDTRDGINGGADYIRWIRTPDHARDAADFFAEHCDRVRVSPFLDGVPCSIHGIVLSDGVVVLRPVELASLRDVQAGRFFYGGMGTTWDPPAADTQAMRRLARELGDFLRTRHHYRGAFGLDGVLTAEGFRATEFNARFSGGLSRLAHWAPAANLELVQINALIGRDVGLPADQIEELALEDLDSHRFVDVIGTSTARRATQTEQVRVADLDGRLQAVDDDAEETMGSLSCGPAPMGSFVRFAMDDATLGPGIRGSRLAVEMLALSDRLWATGFGALEAPASVR